MSTPSSSTSESKPRQRKSNSKVKTGCKTCRVRRVKCGEEKPSCKRCIDTGRVCDGYETVRLAQAVTSSTGELTLRWVRPSSQPPDTTVDEQAAFHHFRVHILDNLAGPFDPAVWHRDVLAMAMSEATIRNAVIALGALGRTDDEGKSDAFALRHYSMALKSLRDKIPLHGQGSTHLTLVTCLLFVAFEFQKLGYAQAKSHLDGGLSIIRELREHGRPRSQETSHSLIEAFERLDIQMSLFTTSRVHLNRIAVDQDVDETNRNTEFENVEDAFRRLNIHMAAMRELMHIADGQRFSGRIHDDFGNLRPHQQRQLDSLSGWEAAFTRLLNRLTKTRNLQAARILQIQHLCCRLMVATSLQDGREALWDDHLADFGQILHLAQTIQETISTMEESRCQHSFRLDMGIIAPVYFTVMKCRHPVLRRQAIAILSNCDYQEGAWTGHTMAGLARMMVYVEEDGLVNPRTERDVLERNRLYRAWYDLTISDRVLYCTRRCFEQDGGWIDYVVDLNRFAVPIAAVLPSQSAMSNSE